MIIYKTKDEIELIRHSSLLVSKTLAYLADLVKPGITTFALDKAAEEFIRDHNAVPSFKGYSGFPATLCTSLNEVVVHGIPSKREIKDGDVVSIDCGVYCNGYHGDSAYSFLMEGVSVEVEKLAEVTKAALYIGIDKAVAGNRIGDVSYAIQNYCESYGYSMVRELVGHGLGRDLHEEPEVPNFGKSGKGPKILEGLAIAIEPMVNMGTKNVVKQKDNWTISTKDKKVSMHYEHTVAIVNGVAEILSSFEPIENAEHLNQHLFSKNMEIAG